MKAHSDSGVDWLTHSDPRDWLTVVYCLPFITSGCPNGNTGLTTVGYHSNQHCWLPCTQQYRSGERIHGAIRQRLLGNQQECCIATTALCRTRHSINLLFSTIFRNLFKRSFSKNLDTVSRRLIGCQHVNSLGFPALKMRMTCATFHCAGRYHLSTPPPQSVFICIYVCCMIVRVM
jgi:hypothetical protein